MSSLTKKIVSVATIFTLAGFIAAPVAQATTVAELEALIASLTAQLNDLQAQLSELEGGAEGIPDACTGITFDTNLKLGSRGAAVKCLQALLNTDADTQVATTGAGSSGNETTYFGTKTKAAVIKFQEKYASAVLTPLGLTTGTGFVGSATRAKLNAILAAGIEEAPPEGCECTAWAAGACGGGTCAATTQKQYTRTCTPAACDSEAKCVADASCAVVTPAAAADLTITALATPAAGRVVVSDVSESPSVLSDFANFTFAAGSENVTVTEINITRSGLAADADILTAYLYDGSTVLGSTTFTDKVARFAASSLLTIPANTSKTISLKAVLDSDNVGSNRTYKFGIAAASDVTADVTVKGTFPANGNEMTSVEIDDLGTLTVDAPDAISDVDPGETDYTVFSTELNANDSDMEVTYIKFTNVGTCESDALQDFKLLVDNVQKGDTVSSLTSDGTLEFDFSAAPIAIEEDKDIDLVLTADIVKGSNDTFRLSIEDETDLLTTEKDYDVVILAAGTFPKNAAAATINPGALTVKKSTDSTTATLVKGDKNISLAKFDLKATGEDIQIRELEITTTMVSASSTPSLSKGKIYLDGSWIGSQNDLKVGATTTVFSSLNKTISAGTTGVLEVKADIESTKSTNPLQNGDTIKISISNIDVKKLSSKAYATYAATAVPANELTVGVGSLSVAATATYGAQNVTAPTNDFKIASYTFSAGSGEGIKVETIKVDLYDKASGAKMTKTSAFDLDWLSNLKISESSSIEATPSASETFSVSFTLAANTSKVVDVYADISADATAGKTMYVKLTATGETDVSAVEQEQEDKTGQEITIKAGTLTMTKATDTPDSALVLGGDVDVAMAKYTFKANYEAFTLNAIKVEVSPPADFSQVWIASGGTSSAKQVVGSAGTVTFTDLPVTVSKDTEVDVSVYADINTIAGAAKSGDAPQVAIVYYKATSTSQTKEVSGTFAANKANAMALYKTKPVVEFVDVANKALAATNSNKDIFSFKVTPDAKGAVTIKGLQLAIAANQITVLSGLKIYYGSTEITATVTSTPTTITFTGMTEKISSVRTYVVKAGTITAPDADNSALTTNFDTNTLTQAFIWDDNSDYGVTTTDATYLKLPANSVTLAR